MGGSNAAISPEKDVLGQLDWLRAELEAQRQFLVRIPEVQMTAQPLADQPSLIGFYQDMLSKEKGYLASLSVTAPTLSDVENSIGALIDAIISCRSALLDELSQFSEDDWQKPMGSTEGAVLLEWAYQITLQDGDLLRRVAERLHESQLSLGGIRPDGP